MINLMESARNARNARPSQNTLPGGGYCDYGNMVERLDIRGMPMLVVQKADGKMVKVKGSRLIEVKCLTIRQ